MDNRQNKLGVIIIAFLMCISSITMAQNFKSEADSISYSVGLIFAKQMKQQGMTSLNKEMVSQAIDDYMNGRKTLIAEQECETIMRNHMTALATKKTDLAKAEGVKFLAQNATKEGVKTTDSGLQYKVITEGSGTSPVATDRVKVHYTGKLIDGTVFDSSVQRGTPATFGVGQVIPGWIEGLQMMKPGAKYEFTIPSNLGYGPRGTPSIPGNSVLIFDVELIEIVTE